VIYELREEEAKNRFDYQAAYAMRKGADLWEEKTDELPKLLDNGSVSDDRRSLLSIIEEYANATIQERLRKTYRGELYESQSKVLQFCETASTLSGYELLSRFENFLFE
jgi:hypothetical protein